MDRPPPDQSSPPAPGALIADRYLLDRELGRGGMGFVFVGRDLRLHRPVAVKFMRAEAPTPTAVLRFEQEARAAAGIQHANVLCVFDFGQHGGAPFLVSELLSGTTLRERLQQPVGLSHEQALALGVQLARGLAAAHAQGVVHRDLKPENAFLCADGTLKILDFGLARLLEPVDQTQSDQGGEGPPPARMTGTGEVMGTSGYMAPEQVRGASATPASDVFAFGAVLYELLAGAPAFRGSTHVERGYAILRFEPPPLGDEVPASLRALVHRCLRKEPAQRFQSGADVAFTLEALAAPGKPGLPPPAHPFSKLRAASALAAVAILASGAAWVAAPRAEQAAPLAATTAAAQLPASIEQMCELARAQSTSPAALEAFRKGELALRRGDRVSALTLYREAVSADEAMAVAHYRIAVTATIDEPGLSVDAARRALGHAGGDPTMVALSGGMLALLQGRTDEAIAAFRGLTEREPDLVEAWVQLGDTVFHASPFRGERPERAADLFARALALDPGEPAALQHLLDLAELNGQKRSIRSLAERLGREISAVDRRGPAIRWAHAWAADDAAERARVLEELRSVHASEVKEVFLHAVWIDPTLEGPNKLGQLLAGRASAADRAQGLDLLAQVSWARGRPNEALALLEQALAEDPAPIRAYLFGWLTAEAASLVPPQRLARAVEWLNKVDGRSKALFPALSLHLLGKLALAAGDVEATLRRAAELEQMPWPHESSVPADLALSLRARVEAARHHPEAALKLLERMQYLYPYQYLTILTRVPEHFLRAELLEELGRPDQARSWLEHAAAHDGPFEMLFFAPGRLRLGRLLERTGERARAAEAFASVTELWRLAEPDLQPQLAAAKEALKRLRGIQEPPPPGTMVRR